MAMSLRFALALALLAAFACGGSVASTGSVACVDACLAVSTACPAKAPHSGCASSCQNVDPLFEAACPDAYHAYLDCLSKHPGDLCSATATSCSEEISTFDVCSSQVCDGTTVCN